MPVQRATVGVLAVLALAACGGGTRYPAPAEPEAAARQFLDAVRANSVTAMGQIWGTERGPAVAWMERSEMEQRLTVMQRFLRHDRFDIVRGNEGMSSAGYVVRVRLYRNGCTPVVPFTMVRYGQGWLVQQVDLQAAGNPQVTCQSR